MKESLLIAAGAIVSIAVACSGPDFQSEVGSGGSTGVGGSSTGKGGSSSGGATSAGGSPSSGGSTITPAGGSNPGTGGSQGQSGGSQAGGGPGLCTDSSECASSSSPCLSTYCDPLYGCIEELLPDGPVPDDVPGDCRYWVCVGGLEELVADPNDFDDFNECTSDACTMQGHEHEVLPGAACTGGICDYDGVCRQCDVVNCPDGTECMMPMCGADGCELGPRPRGTLCAQDTNQCDGEGNCVDCTDSGGCGECCVCSAQNTCVDA